MDNCIRDLKLVVGAIEYNHSVDIMQSLQELENIANTQYTGDQLTGYIATLQKYKDTIPTAKATRQTYPTYDDPLIKRKVYDKNISPILEIIGIDEETAMHIAAVNQLPKFLVTEYRNIAKKCCWYYTYNEHVIYMIVIH